MKHLDLFSGIGGFSLAASWVWGDEHEIVAFVENEPFCQKVLKKHWPDVPIVEDVRNYDHDGTDVTLLTGGFPCQPFSVAGKRRSDKDDRYLWPETMAVIAAVKPHYILLENVIGIIKLALDTVLFDLEAEGYATGTLVIPACAKDAPHRRDRVWIIANAKCGRCDPSQQLSHGNGNTRERRRKEYSDSDSYAPKDAQNTINRGDGRRNNGGQAGGKCSLQAEGPDSHAPHPTTRRLQEQGLRHQDKQSTEFHQEDRTLCHHSADTIKQGLQRGSGLDKTETGRKNTETIRQNVAGYSGNAWDESWPEVATRLCRVDDGVPTEMDRNIRRLGKECHKKVEANRVDRLKALGNAIVPQVAYEIMKAIREI